MASYISGCQAALFGGRFARGRPCENNSGGTSARASPARVRRIERLLDVLAIVHSLLVRHLLAGLAGAVQLVLRSIGRFRRTQPLGNLRFLECPTFRHSITFD